VAGRPQGNGETSVSLSEQVSVFEKVGGAPFFASLVDRFYQGVAGDDLLRPMYPEDLSGAAERLTMFLCQYWGGPDTYSQQRGHPRLRMRHGPYRVDRAARDAWLAHMISALEQEPPPEPIRSAMIDYFVRSADFMRNVDEGPEEKPSEAITPSM